MRVTAAAARRVSRQPRYQREYRQRRRRGEEMPRIKIGPRVIEALLVSQRLSDEASRDLRKVAAELAEVLEQWANEWLK
jgi:hypothetical protein